MRKIKADFLIPVSGEPIKDATLVLDDAGTVLDVLEHQYIQIEQDEIFKGCLVPGLINSHCHLELSHLKGKIPTNTGLISFIKSVIVGRNATHDIIQNAISEALDEMLNNGIVAVGDISNTNHTFKVKAESNLCFHTFVEFFDLLDHNRTEETVALYNQVFLEAPENEVSLFKARVPHAPYSVSKKLLSSLEQLGYDQAKTISIHNEEALAENQFFIDGSGDFKEFYKNLGIRIHHQPTGLSSLKSFLPHVSNSPTLLLVHNTFASKEDIDFAHSINASVYWCACPKANLYIENKLPNYQMMYENGCKLVIGTDSLASNDSLNILDEAKILEKNSKIPSLEILKMATLNGANCLGFRHLGSFEKGKKPGVNLLTNFFNASNKKFSFSEASIKALI